MLLVAFGPGDNPLWGVVVSSVIRGCHASLDVTHSGMLLVAFGPGDNPLWGVVVSSVIRGYHASLDVTHSGMFPCFFGGMESRLVSSMAKEEISFRRSSRGWMTSSM